MTVSSTTVRWEYTGDGATTAFAYTTRIFATSDLKVYLDGMLQASGYTVSGAGSASGGNVTFSTAPASAVAVLIVKEIPETQETDWTDGDDFPANVLEDAVDKLTMLIHQVRERMGRALQLGVTSTFEDLPVTDPVAGEYLRWATPATSGIESASLTGSGEIGIPVSIAEGGTNAITAAAARSNLAVPGLATENTFTGAQHFSLGTAIDDDDVDGSNILTLPADGNTFAFTGTQQVDAIATWGVGSTVRLVCGSARTFTHHATDLILPGAVDLDAVSGDILDFEEYAAGDWRLVGYLPAGAPPVPYVRQMRTTHLLDFNTATSQNGWVKPTDWDETITLKNAANFIRVRASASINVPASAGNLNAYLGISSDGTTVNTRGTNYEAKGESYHPGNDPAIVHVSASDVFAPGTVGPHTVSLLAFTNTGAQSSVAIGFSDVVIEVEELSADYVTVSSD